ncbi:MAG: hypothetical protein IKU60_01780 [Clostridia bacterium]|nr:hypothetical protein [Clostridia bacterium]
MKKILALMLAVMMLASVAVQVSAEESYQLTVPEGMNVTVNSAVVTGTVEVTESDKVEILADEEFVALMDVNSVYYDVNSEFTLTADADLTGALFVSLGLKMVDGAQVRVGDVELSEDGKVDATADSGLRFIATANYTDTVIADESVEFGIKVIAEASENPIYVKAEKFQRADKSVFSAAITKLAESNYNRKYTACAYALIPMHDGTVKEVVTGSVTRSIYQVSVGIMKNSSAEADSNLPYTIDEAVKNVLNAYVNQAGIRLTYKDGNISARVSGKGAYTGDVYFDVQSTLNANGGTDVVIRPYSAREGFGNPITIEEWWQEYIRINNNNTEVVTYISNAELKDGVLSFTFTIPQEDEVYDFDEEGSVTVVSEVGDGYIKGFKNGAEVTYALANKVEPMGLAESMDEIVPGCVIMEGYNSKGQVGAVELLASIGMPVNPDVFTASYGVYDAVEGTKYKNVVTKMTGKSGAKLTCQTPLDSAKVYYTAESGAMAYRVGVAMSGDEPVISIRSSEIAKRKPSVFDDSSKFDHYIYLRYNTETSKVKECILYCVPKDLDFSGDGEYSDIFSLDSYRVILD